MWCWCTAVLSLGLYPNQIGTDLDCCLSLPTRWVGYGLPTTSGNNELVRLALLKLVYVNCEFIWSLDNLAIGRARFFAIWILQSIFFSFLWRSLNFVRFANFSKYIRELCRHFNHFGCALQRIMIWWLWTWWFCDNCDLILRDIFENKKKSYVGVYHVYNGITGEGLKQVRVGQLNTTLGTLSMSVAYRTKMTISPTQTGRDTTIMLKSDHFLNVSPKNARYQSNKKR